MPKKKDASKDKYEKARYFVKCRKCGIKALDKVSGHVCIRCGGTCDKV